MLCATPLTRFNTSHALCIKDTEASDDAGDGVRRWGSVKARFGKKFKDVWVGRIAS